jgi:hypothetical protein
MTDHRIEIRTELAASKTTRVDIGQDGVLHVLAGPITLHLDRATCEELTTTLARAMVALARSRRPRLRLVADSPGEQEAGGAPAAPAPCPASGSAAPRGSNEPGPDRLDP